MFCRQCGKEIADGARFCKYCGASQGAGNQPVAAKPQAGTAVGNTSQTSCQKKLPRKGPKKGKGGIIAALVVVILLVIAAGVGAVLYFTSDSYQIKKNLKLADECFAEEEYEEALDYYKAALKLDRSLVEAYLGSADIYIEKSEYQNAVDILEKGLDKVRGKKKDALEERLEDAYSLWVTALVSREDYDGARAVLDEGVPEAGAATDSVESSKTEDTPASEVLESSESAPEEPEQPKFILPESDSRYLAMEDLAGLTAEECRIARNELFARHGRLFKDEELQAYFNSCDWYYGWVMPEDFDETVFNEYEFANRDLIIKYEKEQGYR